MTATQIDLDDPDTWPAGPYCDTCGDPQAVCDLGMETGEQRWLCEE